MYKIRGIVEGGRWGARQVSWGGGEGSGGEGKPTAHPSDLCAFAQCRLGKQA